MKTSSKIFLAIAIAALAILFALKLRHAPPSPESQISSQIAYAVAAANVHNAAGVMSIISAHYADDNGLNVDKVHVLLLRGLRQNATVQVSMSPSQITVEGDRATSVGRLIVQDAQSGQTLYNQEITLQWDREPARSYLLFPSAAWRVVGASYGSMDVGAGAED